MVSGYPAYMLNQESNKSEVNYFVYGAEGTVKVIGDTERGGTVGTYDNLMATTGQEGGPLLCRYNYCFDW